MNGVATKTPRPWLQAVARWTATLLMLWFVFGFLLPRFIDYREVAETIATLRPGEALTLLLLALAFSLSESWVYTGVIPGLEFWPGWQAYQASGSLAAFTPPGVDMAVRYGMYRSFGVPAKEAGAGFVLSGIFTIGVKFVLPVVALILVLLSGQYARGTTIIVTIAFAVAVIALAILILRRESLTRWLGRRIGGWYNRLLAGRWRFEPIGEPGQKLVDFRGQVVGTLGKVWQGTTAALLGSQLVSYLILLLALRFLGVSASEANFGLIFVAYAVGLIAALVPLLPQGLGAVELVYVLVISGTKESELADVVMAAAFVHRIFTWFLPILWGFAPLILWRRRARPGRGHASRRRSA